MDKNSIRFKQLCTKVFCGVMLPRARSFRYAAQGIITAFRSERNLRFQLLISGLIIAASWYFQLSATEWILVLMCCAMVIGFELMNTAMEYFINQVEPQKQHWVANVKDIAAGAVLVVSIFAALIGFIIFLPKLY